MSKNQKHDMASVLDALDHSDGDIDHPQEMLIELQDGFSSDHKRLEKKTYEKELARLQSQLVKMQYWVKATGFRLIILKPVAFTQYCIFTSSDWSFASSFS